MFLCGSSFSYVLLLFQSNVVVSGPNLVTGQNPQSAGAFVQALINMIL
jgi:putative intracellular protease/amidase